MVHMVDPVEEGYRFERKRMSWPLHMTLAPWFSAPDPAEVDRALQDMAAHHEPFEVTVGEVERFGPQKSVAVNVIREIPEMHELHQGIYDALRKTGATFVSERFMGRHFRPHVTRHEPDGHYAHQGDTLPINDFHLVRLLEGNICEVAKPYELGYNK